MKNGLLFVLIGALSCSSCAVAAERANPLQELAGIAILQEQIERQVSAAATAAQRAAPAPVRPPAKQATVTVNYGALVSRVAHVPAQPPVRQTLVVDYSADQVDESEDEYRVSIPSPAQPTVVANYAASNAPVPVFTSFGVSADFPETK